jgi:adenosylcobinamide-GDP ribazoletransferase
VRGALLAISFLTVLPVRLRGEVPRPGAAAGWFPVVGAAIGALAGGIRAAFDPLVGPATASTLAVGTLIVVTGALHQDGLADCADGLGVRGDRERRLNVMRDSSIGTFGALALLIWVLLVVGALAQLSRGDAVLALIAACATARGAAVVHAARVGPARPDGLGAGFVVGRLATAIATAASIAALALCLPLDAAAGAVAAVALVAIGSSEWAKRTLGGRTGDTLGACVALAEAAVLLVALGFQGPS